MYPNIDPAKLADVQNVASKLANLPEKALVYIAGYTEGTLSAQQIMTHDSAPEQARK